MDTPDQTHRQQVAKLAKDVFQTRAEERAVKRAAEENRVLNGVSKLNNTASYLPALTDLACKQLQEDIIAFARIHAREFTRFGLPSDVRVESDLDTVAIQMAGGTHAHLFGQLNLIEKRTKRQVMLSTSSGHIARNVARSANLGVRKGKIILRRQRIKASRPEAVTAIGSCQQNPQKRDQELIVSQEHQKVIHRTANPPLAYPSWRYHGIKPGKIVKDAAEDAALGPGWVKNPDAFGWNNFKDRIWTQQTPDPLRWSSEWLGQSSTTVFETRFGANC
jgi:hypothetical protein